MIRISTQQMFSNGISRLQSLNANLQKTEEQISTGKKVNRASDDPVAAARILKLDQEVARIEQYQRNAGLAENRLNQEEGALTGMVDVVQRIRELTVQAGNATLSDKDRDSIASELRQRLDQLGNLANTRDASGEYIFSGFQGDTPAFGKNISGHYVYQGDEGQRFLEIDEGVRLAISDHGKGIFVDIPSAHTTFFAEASATNTSGAQISTGMVLDQEAYDGFVDSLSGDDLIVRFQDDGLGGLNYEVVAKSEPEPKTVLATGPYSSGDSIVFEGIQFEITGAQLGDTFDIKTSGRQSMFTSIEKLIYGLENQPLTPAQATIDGTTGFVPNTGDVMYINGVALGPFTAGDTVADLDAAINANIELKNAGVSSELNGNQLVITGQGQDLRISGADESVTPAVTTWTGDLTVGGGKFEDLSIVGGVGVAAVNVGSGQQAYYDLIADSLINLDNIQDSILLTQTELGGRMNAVETTSDFLEDSSLYSKDIRSQLQDVDYAEAISTLSFQSFVLQAAQQSFAQVSQLSLFDRL
ncbi:flagellar hook-associated protein FlgL [Marinobacter zhejiangensis]|uniref:Flagellar hook-associated protein 3 n=1 Tax=Marinobacter zhejiangensis TaxID=488535 RepID=A0A1I4P839_9GAMM|nr:flagellar hook-associated protein FlgL [Marinobacter zhejiangensis]SFM23869.1 flagellar hook-associated protein 3 [Marinobacter zhejiangensis]